MVGMVLQGCRLFKRCQNQPARHCVTGGAGCLRGVRTYLLDTVLQVAGCLSYVGTFLQGTLGQGCRLFKGCQNLPPRQYGAGVQAV